MRAMMLVLVLVATQAAAEDGGALDPAGMGPADAGAHRANLRSPKMTRDEEERCQKEDVVFRDDAARLSLLRGSRDWAFVDPSALEQATIEARSSLETCLAASRAKSVEPPRADQSKFHPRVEFIVGDGCVAAGTKELVEKVISYATAGNREAIGTLMDAKVVIVLKVGTRVSMKHPDSTDDVVEARPAGTSTDIWVARRALSKAGKP